MHHEMSRIAITLSLDIKRFSLFLVSAHYFQKKRDYPLFQLKIHLILLADIQNSHNLAGS